MLRAVSPLSRWLGLGTVIAMTTLGCKNKQEQPEKPREHVPSLAQAASSAKKNAPADLSPPPAEIVQPVVNPRKLPVYGGPTGGVRGTIKITGDLAPNRPEVLAKIEEKCAEAEQMFAQVFREGPGRTLADALVAVTGYDGYVPPATGDVIVKAKGCAFTSRTVTMTFGQRLLVEGLDKRPYVPEILGQPQAAQLFVLPTSPSVSFAPKRPGRFKLVDSLRLYNLAELFILPYPTAAVTGLDGRFDIQGIPVGPAKINALLPQTGGGAGQEITIEKGKTIQVDLEINFDRSVWDKLPKEVALDEIPAAGSKSVTPPPPKP